MREARHAILSREDGEGSFADSRNLEKS